MPGPFFRSRRAAVLPRDGRKKRSLFYSSDLGKLIKDIQEETEGHPFKDVLKKVLDCIMFDPQQDESVSNDYELLLTLSQDYGTTSDYLLAFATDKDRFAPFFLSDYKECEVDTSEEFLTISTIHSAKGLEWDKVFIMGLCEGNFPNDYFCKGLSAPAREAFFNGEWKKMYVASTRARESLTLTYPGVIKRKGYTFQKEASRFITTIIRDDSEEPATKNHRAIPVWQNRPYAC